MYEFEKINVIKNKAKGILFNRLLSANKFMYQVVIYDSISTKHVYDTSQVKSYTTIQHEIMSKKN